MTKLYIGKIVNTHGIKGELRIKDNLTTNQRNEIFKIGSNLIIDDKAYKITSYRVHKDYDMVTFDGFTNINEVLFLKGKKVYKSKDEINLHNGDILDSELVTYKVKTTDEKEGKILDIEETGNNYKILRLLIDNNEVLVPYHKDFVKIDSNKKEVIVKLL
ncbi:MAG TPA: 16S rRNA processing protein RimM [Candidatus Onthousia excrementipullorum]|uniref:Ribosome maturation factor RimM n=1 Tax=Candidatus Onthousia excrementipullorum TaxID=2840884 RepID=A0A9D1J368_9FIRM|nr:16S rRNA processing protein RimM [Candidatus Onthousia excrementipullorum]